MAAFTSPRLQRALDLERLIVREDLQQDKQSTLMAVARLFSDFAVPYAITGGLAIQLYSEQPRHTGDVDVVTLRQAFKALSQAEPWAKYGFELVFDRRRYIKLRHVTSNVDVDINTDTRFVRLLDGAIVEPVQGLDMPFVAPFQLAFAKLRTQRSDWPRDPFKRDQDRLDLGRLIKAEPSIIERLRLDPEVTDEMRDILEEVVKRYRSAGAEEVLPSDSDADEA